MARLYFPRFPRFPRSPRFPRFPPVVDKLSNFETPIPSILSFRRHKYDNVQD
ncbi:hypothetical protein MC7420_2214 [Coleofasciculus chthonoplastes PCC 7420]|uniref:Uncharacterized protein n=1 Tax=Coleofasciculus chthonoplastes PCC 7420 TaxID=118168 RepID=B4VS61_9CYAN|nr:hypothetical protein MC7420_2214 [Coleofasciculus chthonoplastes PCC 7420]